MKAKVIIVDAAGGGELILKMRNINKETLFSLLVELDNPEKELEERIIESIDLKTELERALVERAKSLSIPGIERIIVIIDDGERKVIVAVRTRNSRYLIVSDVSITEKIEVWRDKMYEVVRLDVKGTTLEVIARYVVRKALKTAVNIAAWCIIIRRDFYCGALRRVVRFSYI